MLEDLHREYCFHEEQSKSKFQGDEVAQDVTERMRRAFETARDEENTTALDLAYLADMYAGEHADETLRTITRALISKIAGLDTV